MYRILRKGNLNITRIALLRNLLILTWHQALLPLMHKHPLLVQSLWRVKFQLMFARVNHFYAITFRVFKLTTKMALYTMYTCSDTKPVFIS